MKTISLIYVISLLILATAIFMVVGFPGINKAQVIAGGLTFVGFALNIATYVFRKREIGV